MIFQQPDPYYCELGLILEKKRNKWGMNKVELCKRVGMSVSQYNYIIHGKKKCADGYLEAFIRELELESEIREVS